MNINRWLMTPGTQEQESDSVLNMDSISTTYYTDELSMFGLTALINGHWLTSDKTLHRRVGQE